MVDEALQAFGLYAEQPAVLEEEFWLLPENVTAFGLWLQVQTQWHRDFGQPIGLNYASVLAVLDLNAKGKKDRAKLFASMQVMESAALAVWSKSK